MAIALGNLTKATLRLGDIPAADGYAHQCLELERAAGNPRGILLSLECLGEIRLATGNLAAARTVLDESLTLSRTLGDLFGEAMALHQLGQLAHAEGHHDEALRLFAGALARRHELGDREDLAVSLDSVARLIIDREPALAAQLLGAAEGLRERHRLPAPADDVRDAAREAVVSALGERAFSSAWSGGRSAPLGLVVDQTLDLVTSAAECRKSYCGDQPAPMIG
jgi:tetratricopeptide (TPR) repeat protein